MSGTDEQPTLQVHPTVEPPSLPGPTVSNMQSPVEVAVTSFGGPTSRLPQFYRSNPSLWFLQIEAVFATSRVTSPHIRFQAVVSVLELEVLTQVADLLTTDSADPYTLIKQRLITIYGESETRRIQKLLEDTQLGNQRPSQLYRQMLQLAANTVSKEIVRTLWLRNLPVRVQEILAATKQEDIDALTVVADKIMEVEKPPEAYAVFETTSSSTTNEAVLAEIKKLRAEVADLRLQARRSRSQNRRRTSVSGSRSHAASSDRGLCFYHRRFGNKASKCTKPCTWTPDPNLNA